MERGVRGPCGWRDQLLAQYQAGRGGRWRGKCVVFLWWKEIVFWHIMRHSRPRFGGKGEGGDGGGKVRGRSATRVVSVPNYGEHCH